MESNQGQHKLIQINTVCVGSSTGRIMGNIQREAMAQGWETLSIVGRRALFPDLPSVRCGTPAGFWLHVFRTCLNDGQGLGSGAATRRMIARLRSEKPEVILLHNLHGYYLNYPMLFDYLREEFHGKILWFLHDSWSYTGHCAFYTADCDRFKTRCHDCPHSREYPWCFVLEGSGRNFDRKKAAFCGLPNLELIAPSAWIAGQVKQSFLGEYPVHVIPNGISPERFFPDRSGEEALRERYGIPREAKILLGVASAWNERKGLPDFRALAEKLPGDYRIVLIGLNRAQQSSMPPQVICVPLLSDPADLRGFYSCSFALVNASREESFSLVTIEAFACGLPVIGLDNSAVKELISDETGILLHRPAAEDYLRALDALAARRADGTITEEKLLKRAGEYTNDRQAKDIVACFGG